MTEEHGGSELPTSGSASLFLGVKPLFRQACETGSSVQR